MAEKKRIALFINSLSGGGAERVVSRIARELDKEYGLYIFLVEGKKKVLRVCRNDRGSGERQRTVYRECSACGV